MRITIVSDQYAPMVGGVPSVTKMLARGLVDRGNEVALLVPSRSWRGGVEVDDGLVVGRRGSLPWPWYQSMRLACTSASAARRVIADFAPDIVHVQSPLSLGIASQMAARRLNIPVVYTNHYLPANARPSTKARSAMFDRAFYAYLVDFANRCSLTTAPTATALDLLRQRGLQVASTVISNGVDLRRFGPGPAADQTRRRYRPDRGAPLILAVGRLSPEKRLDVLLKAVSRLGEGVDVAIAGAGPAGPSLHALASRLDLGRRVRFLGFVPDADLPDLYRLADIFAIPSAAELQSLTTLEAMASGLPVVAADAYALPELVGHGRSGFLATPGSPDDLAAHLDKLITDRSLRSSMGAQSVARVRPHDLHVVLDRWESCYRALAVVGP